MPLSNFTRPDYPYVNAPLPNDNRFYIITRILKRRVKDEEFEFELNSGVDRDNILDRKIEDVVAGNIPGSDNPLNALKFLTTDGAGTLSFVFVTNNNVEGGALSGTKITPLTIGTDQLDNGIITPDKVPNDSMSYSKMNFQAGDIPYVIINVPDEAIPYPKLNIPDNTIPYPKLNIPDNTIPYPKLNIPDNTIPYPKLNIPNNTIPGAAVVGKSITQEQQGLLSVGTSELIDGAGTTSKIANGAITNQKLENAGQMVPFAMGYISEAAVMLKQKNIASVVLAQTGEFNITFSTPASNANYIVSPGIEAGDNRTIVIFNGTKTTNGFTIRTFAPNGTLSSLKFNFIVYSF